jgi:hypothetical protein
VSDNPQLSPGNVPDREPINSMEQAIIPLDDADERFPRLVSARRPRHVTLWHRITVTGLVLLILLAVVLSAGGLWPQVGAAWQAAHGWLHLPRVVVQSPVPWAQVWVDGHLAGETDTPIALGLGKHTITVQATGFAPYTHQLTWWETLQSMHTMLAFYAPARTLPGVIAQMERAINRALDATYGTTIPVAPGEPYAPGLVTRVPLQARLTVTMITDGPLFTCTSTSDPTCQQQVDSGLAGTPDCLRPLPSPDTLCISPYLALLGRSGSNSPDAIVSVRAELVVQFRDVSTGRLVHITLVPAAGYQNELVQIGPGHNGWQVAATFVDASILSDLQTQAGAATLQALLPADVASQIYPFNTVALNPPGEGILFETELLPPAPAILTTWLFHLGMLFAVDAGAHQVTPELPRVPPALIPLIQQACSICLG